MDLSSYNYGVMQVTLMSCVDLTIAVKTKTVMAKMDQMNRKVLISSSTQRTFGKQNWMELNSQLLMWKNNLDKIKQGFNLILTQGAEQL